MPAFSDQAFATFYAATSRRLWTYVYRVTGNAADADDIVQEAFVRVLRADRAALDDEQRRRYLFRVASNLMADRWRKHDRELSWWSHVFRAPWATPIVHTADDTHEELRTTFAALTPRERALLWLAYVEDQSHNEIASALGLKPASVKVLLFRARARLRDLLAAHPKEAEAGS